MTSIKTLTNRLKDVKKNPMHHRDIEQHSSYVHSKHRKQTSGQLRLVSHLKKKHFQELRELRGGRLFVLHPTHQDLANEARDKFLRQVS
ncbi:hypothetical protein SDC9_150444 [bioreactor metagenome]|uniref:Uncharacterized protein n=1 Tax=bioreactor metagenome TaxID=1076179 RepID=A0A645EMH7_9ZZZZ